MSLHVWFKHVDYSSACECLFDNSGCDDLVVWLLGRHPQFHAHEPRWTNRLRPNFFVYLHCFKNDITFSIRFLLVFRSFVELLIGCLET